MLLSVTSKMIAITFGIVEEYIIEMTMLKSMLTFK